MKIRRLISGVMCGIMTMGVMNFRTFAADSVNITVGSGGFATVQQAIDSVKAGQSAVITITPGTYEEGVVVDKPNIKLVNNNKSKEAVITYDRGPAHSDPAKKLGTEKSATFLVTEKATGFSADNIVFKNTYNIGTSFEQGQAVAFESLADKVVLENCSFIGRQDTLYLKGASKGKETYGSANPARVYLKNCYIEGTVDFIFGDATAYFDNCKLFMAYSEKGGHFTAANTTLFNIGYVFDRCQFLTDDKYKTDSAAAAKVDLGRPWQANTTYPNSGSYTAIINSKMSDVIKKEGFSVWGDETVTNKVRYYEYGTTDLKGRPTDISKRDKNICKILTAQQAALFTPYTVLSGSDSWNPLKAKKTNESAFDVTLDKYSIELPQGETTSIKAFSQNNKIKSFSSSDSNIAAVDENGKITAVSQGSAEITAEGENGFAASAKISVKPTRTAAPTIKEISIDHISTFAPGTTMTVNYSYALESDNKDDAARISWYLLKDGREILLKKGVGAAYRTYTIQSSEVGCKYKATVEPATKTSYGDYGKAVSVTDDNTVSGSSSTVILTGFNEDTKLFEATNNWTADKTADNYLITANCTEKEPSTIKYTTDIENPYLRVKMRFNPQGTGLSAEDYANIYINKTETEGYKLNIARGSNMQSLKLYIYKVTAEGEKLLASDENTLKNKVNQNSGENNPFFYIDFYKNADTLTAVFRLDGDTEDLCKITGRDTAPLKGGSLYAEFIGKGGIWQLDTLSLENSDNKAKENAIHVYLAGDSTVKDYGTSNTIGGWGEFIKDYFTDDVVIVNKAEGGRSTRSYLNQGRLDEILSLAQPGDYLFIQFGHNDARDDDPATMEHKVQLGTPDEDGIYPSIPAVKTKTPQYIIDFYKNDPYPYGDTFYPYESGTFKWYYEQYINAAKEKGMIPVVITPVCRVFFDENGKITPHFGADNGYVEAVRQVAKENNCTLIDMYDITSSLYESYGELSTQVLHNVKADGSMDLTHYNKFGANLIASKMAESLKAQNIAIAKDTKNSNIYVGKFDALKEANLFVIGDSLADASSKTEVIKSVSFASKLQQFFSDKIHVVDYTKADCTAKGFTKTKEYSEFMSSVNAGDYVILAFGRTDSDKSTTDKILDEYSGAEGDVNTNGSFRNIVYNSYIKPLHDKNAVVIMTTPIVDAKFKNDVVVNGLDDYSAAIRELVTENYLYFVDMNGQSAELFNKMGVEGSKAFNAVDSKAGIERNRLNDFGAETMARTFINMMKYSSATLKTYINESELSKTNILTRGEFTSAMVSVMGVSDTSGTNFKDVAKGKDYYNAVLTAKNLALTPGYVSGSFKPENEIYGNDAVNMLKAALKYKGKKITALNDVYELMPIDKTVSNEIGLYAIDRLFEEIR